MPLDYESVAAAGSMLGTRSVQLFDETTCVVRVVLRWIKFYEHESCGKCTPCREGSYWVVQLLEQLEQGEGSEADLDKLLDICSNITGRAFCALGDSIEAPVKSSIRTSGTSTSSTCGTAAARSTRPPRRYSPWSPPDDRAADQTPQPAEPGGAGQPRAAADGVTVTIDGFEITVPKGTLVIRAAEQLGIQIPRFCDHPLLDPIGACRQCLVHIEGQPKPPASCTTTCTEGMVVHTQLTSPVAEKAQRGMMELLLVNHPLDCPMCDKGGECPLQNQAMSTGQGETRFNGAKRTFPKPIALSTEVLLDRERCIQCARCTRFAEQIAGDPLIELLERGPQEQVGVGRRRAVRLLLLRQHRADLPGRRADRRRLPVPGPAVRPGVHAERVRALRGRAAASAPTTGAARSPGGWPAATRRSTRSGTATRAAGRSPTPPSRTGWPARWCGTPTACCVPASWPEAFAAAARGLAAARGRAGVLTGGRLDRGGRLRLRQVRPGRAGQQRHRHAGPPAFGRGSGVPRRRTWPAADLEVSYADLERAPVVLLAGFEPDDESPIVFLRLRKAARAGHPDRVLHRPAGQPRADPDVRGPAAHRPGRRGGRAGQPDQRHRTG